MIDTHLVSIITPSYNQGDYLPAAVGSVLAQDYPRLEYGIVDGGSTDQSLRVIKDHQDQLNWWISEKDRGQADAVNKGVLRCQGEIVGWLNSDDLYLPGAVQEAVNKLQDTGADMVFGKAITIDQDGKPLNTLEFGPWGLQELMRFRVICQPAVFMKKSVWEAVGGLDPTYDFMLDHQLWLKIAAQFQVAYLDQFLAASRFHHEAKNVSSAAGFSDEIWRLVSWMRETPQLASHYRADRRRIRGGACRLSARYLLDGGYPGRSLSAYLKALYYWPGFALEHSHRMAYAAVNLLLGRKQRPRLRSRIPPFLPEDLNLENWPGSAGEDRK
jgi:glycosyltransferase involved in cell wall biosynthesis